MRWLAILFVGLCALGCPSRSDMRPTPSKACTKFGDSCEFSPGKLGTCVALDPCTKSGDCFVCQSQH
jgi:hypothetical protein